MPGKYSYLIIGNGIAGVTAAELLRNEDSAADITVIADDPFPVYYRPALKDYLAGRVREDKLWARPNSFYQDHRIRFLSDRAVGLQAGQHTIQLQSGREVAYDRLLLANGASASRLSCPGIDLVGVTTLRTVADYQKVVSQLSMARRIVVSGSGTLALETIETLRHRGHHVTHLLRRRTLWTDVLDTTASDLVLQQERRDGVDVRIEEELAEVMGKNGKASGVVTTSGARIPCDMVIMAIGVEPNIGFIKSSGIPCGRGVQVDSAMCTSAPDIYAAGDILETEETITRRTRVIGQWYPAIQQGRAAAYSMLNLLDTHNPFHSSNFYNATFLYGLEFASVGSTHIPADGKGYQEIIADPLPRIYRKVILKEGIPVGMLALGNRKNALALKRAIDHKVNLSPISSHLFTEDFKLNDWLDQEGVPPAILGAARLGARDVQQAAYAAGTIAGATILKPQPPMEAFLVSLDEVEHAHQREQSRQHSQEKTFLSQTNVMTIGRQAGAFLLIDHDSVSRRHAEISYVNQHYIVRDLGSSNGTFVNEVRLEADKAYILKPEDRVRFGKVQFFFQVQVANLAEQVMISQRSESAPGITTLHELTTGFYDPSMADQVLPPSGQPVLNADGSLLLPGANRTLPADIVATFQEVPALIVLLHGSPQVVSLKQGRRKILGRDKTCDVVLADVAASRRHAEIFPGPDGFYIHDLGSANGLVVNQIKLDNPYLLVHGDCIRIGEVVIFYMNVRQEERVGVITNGDQSMQRQEHAEQTLICRNCGASNISIARFCATCGTALENSQAVMKG